MKVNGSDTQHSDTLPLGVEKGRQKNILKKSKNAKVKKCCLFLMDQQYKKLY